ncbi:efflux RND transporter periplasmic adaptor subunit [Vreelandella salicampi]|nr:efflux RND transporter periplasmic adaptor subunit [Halomonas salicampi]
MLKLTGGPRQKHGVRALLAMTLAGLLTTAPLVAAQDARVETYVVRDSERLEVLSVTGSVTAERISQLSSAEAGQVDTLSIALGERVNQGQRLLTLDSREITLEAQRIQADVAQARAERDDARRRLNEANQLSARQNIAASELRQRESTFAAAEATLDAQQARAELAKLRLERHQVHSPFDGMVIERDAEIGEWVDPGDTLLTLVDLDSLKLEFPIPLSVYPRLKEATLEIRLEGNQQWHTATMNATIPQEAPSRQFLLRATLDTSSPMLPGMAATGRLTLTAGNGPSVPRDALIRRPDGSVSVWLVKRKNNEWRANEQRVELGNGHAGKVAIEEGLNIDDRVIVVGNERLEEGQRVSLSDK